MQRTVSALRGIQTEKGIIYGGGKRGDGGLVALERGAEVVERKGIELRVSDGQAAGGVTRVDGLQHGGGIELALEAEGPAKGVRAGHLRIQKTDGLAGEGEESVSGAGGWANALGEGVAERGGGGKVLVVSAHQSRGLTEAGLRLQRVGGVSAGGLERGDGQRRNEHPEAAADGRFAAEPIGGPGGSRSGG